MINDELLGTAVYWQRAVKSAERDDDEGMWKALNRCIKWNPFAGTFKINYSEVKEGVVSQE